MIISVLAITILICKTSELLTELNDSFSMYMGIEVIM